MKFAHLSHVWRKPGMSAAERWAQLWRELALCDELGYDYGFTIEHHCTPHEALVSSPPIYIAAAAARTRNLRLGAMGWVAPLYDPLRVVEEVVQLDNVTEGRLEVGLVAGFGPDQFAPFKVDFSERRPRTIECYELLKTACANPEGFNFKGPYHEYQDIPLQMGPYQKPHPPVWIETQDPDTLAYLAAEGVNTGYVLFVPREDVAPAYREYLNQWQVAGHPHKPNINYWVLVYVDETDQKAWEIAGPNWVHSFTHVQPTTRLIQARLRRGEYGSAKMLEHFTDVPYLREHNIGLIGSPETVAEKIKLYAEEGCFNTVLGEFNFGSLTEEQVMRSIRLFGEEVIPRLRDYEPY